MKISIRSMLILVAVFAVALAWRLDHLRLQKAISNLNAENAEFMGRIIPSSGFAFPSGPVTNPVLVNSSREDRQEIMRLLDQSITHGKNSNLSLTIVDSTK